MIDELMEMTGEYDKIKDYEIKLSIREIASMLSGKPLYHITKDEKVIKLIFKHDEEDEKKDGND